MLVCAQTRRQYGELRRLRLTHLWSKETNFLSFNRFQTAAADLLRLDQSAVFLAVYCSSTRMMYLEKRQPADL